jgi:hypothetical protein
MKALARIYILVILSAFLQASTVICQNRYQICTLLGSKKMIAINSLKNNHPL